MSDAALRGVGLSGQKVGYLRDLCARILDGRLQLDELEALPDEAVIERLDAVKGFGRWTAEMFLMFRLHRPDVLPVGDLGIVNAVQRLYRLRKTPGAEAAAEDRRSVAAVPVGRVLVSVADAAGGAAIRPQRTRGRRAQILSDLRPRGQTRVLDPEQQITRRRSR